MENKSSLPRHIGFIMDGNGRWAKKRLMPRTYGHSRGVNNVIEIVECAFDLGIKAVSLFAFSTENWQRPKEEVDALLDLLRKYFLENIKKLLKEGIKLTVMGDLSALPSDIRKDILSAVESTKNSEKHILNIGINYGGKAEILRAVNLAIKGGKKTVNGEYFSSLLYTGGLPELDLIIRTGGETRLSNFMLYQAAYSEIYFTKTLWPDFHKKSLIKILNVYKNTHRRYGGI